MAKGQDQMSPKSSHFWSHICLQRVTSSNQLFISDCAERQTDRQTERQTHGQKEKDSCFAHYNCRVNFVKLTIT